MIPHICWKAVMVLLLLAILCCNTLIRAQEREGETGTVTESIGAGGEDSNPITPDTPTELSSTGETEVSDQSSTAANEDSSGESTGDPQSEQSSSGNSGEASISSTAAVGDGGAGSGDGPQPSGSCAAIPPPSNGVLIPMYLVDHQTAGSEWNVDFYMTDGFKTRDLWHPSLWPGSTPSFCTGDGPFGCTLHGGDCSSVGCSGASTHGLGINQVDVSLSPQGRPIYRNNANDMTPNATLQLAADPYLTPAIHRHNIHSSDTFSQWFALSLNDITSTGTNYIVKDALFSLVPPTRFSSLIEFPAYLFECEAPCFPLDGQLFGNQNVDQMYNIAAALGDTPVGTRVPSSYGSHNYGFTSQLHTTFQWRGGRLGEFFTIYSTDDSFVYIDDQLVLDLGGLHEFECRTLNIVNGDVTGGIATYIDGSYTCPQTLIPRVSSRNGRFDSSIYTENQHIRLSVFMAQRSAPWVDSPPRPQWRIETNILLDRVTDTNVIPVIPAGGPSPSPLPRISLPPPGFTITIFSGQLDSPNTDSDRWQLSPDIPVCLHDTTKPSQQIMITLNTIPIIDMIIDCVDSKNYTSIAPMVWRQCTGGLSASAYLTLTHNGYGESLVTCHARSSSDSAMFPSNFEGAERSFKVLSSITPAQPVILIEKSPVVFTQAVTTGSVLLDATRSYELDGHIKTVVWKEVRNELSQLVPVTLHEPNALVTVASGLARGGTYEFELRATDEWAQTQTKHITVQVPISASMDDIIESDDTPRAIELRFEGLMLIGQEALGSFINNVLDSLSFVELGSSSDRFFLAKSSPLTLIDQRYTNTVNLTLVIVAASEIQPLASTVMKDIIRQSEQPASLLRTQLPSLQFAVEIVPVPTTKDLPRGPTYMPDSSRNPTYSRVGLGIGLSLSFICLCGICFILRTGWRRRFGSYSRYETESMVGDRVSQSDAPMGTGRAIHSHGELDSGTPAAGGEWAVPGLDHTSDIEMQQRQEEERRKVQDHIVITEKQQDELDEDHLELSDERNAVKSPNGHTKLADEAL